jgi:hypothetical protein
MKVLAVALVVMAILTAVIPAFGDCESQGKMITLANGKQISMKCHWSGRAEIALAVPLLGVGAMMGFSKRKETRRVLSLSGILLGAFIMLVPTVLIGTCSGPDMTCNVILKPATLLLGGLVIAGGLGGLVISERSKDELA